MNLDRVVDRRRSVLEHEVDHRAANRGHPAIERPTRLTKCRLFRIRPSLRKLRRPAAERRIKKAGP